MKHAPGPGNSRYFLMSGLLHAFYWMDEGMQNHMRAAGQPSLTRTQSLIMTLVADGVTRPADLARRLDISRQAVQQLLANMQGRRLVDLVPDRNDARAKIVKYSSRGHDIQMVAARALEHIDEEIERRLGKRALVALRKILVESDWGEPVTAPAQPARTARAAAGTAVRRRRNVR